MKSLHNLRHLHHSLYLYRTREKLLESIPFYFTLYFKAHFVRNKCAIAGVLPSGWMMDKWCVNFSIMSVRLFICEYVCPSVRLSVCVQINFQPNCVHNVRALLTTSLSFFVCYKRTSYGIYKILGYLVYLYAIP